MSQNNPESAREDQSQRPSDETPTADSSQHRAADARANDSADTEPRASVEVERDLERDLEEMRQQLLRTQADLDNFRKRARRELEDERRYAAMPLIRELVAVLDNLQRAIDAAGSAKAAEGAPDNGLREGVQMVAAHLKSVLEQHHCHEIDAVGVAFDPNLHEAVGQAPSTEHPPGHVMHVTLTGYKLHDRVVRPSNVLISTGPPTSSPPTSGAGDGDSSADTRDAGPSSE